MFQYIRQEYYQIVTIGELRAGDEFLKCNSIIFVEIRFHQKHQYDTNITTASYDVGVDSGFCSRQ